MENEDSSFSSSLVNQSDDKNDDDDNNNQKEKEDGLVMIFPKNMIRPFLDTYIELYFGRMAHEPNDDNGMTPLLEATYKGDETSVFLLLLYGTMNLDKQQQQQQQQIKEDQDEEEGDNNNNDNNNKGEDNNDDNANFWYDQQAHVNAQIVPGSSPSPSSSSSNRPVIILVDDMTSLHIAAQSGQGKIVQLLIDHGANCTSKDENGWTPLAWSIYGGYESIVNLFLIKAHHHHHHHTNIVLDWKDNDSGETLLHLAATQGNLSIVQTLVEYYYNSGGFVDNTVVDVVNARSGKYHRTPLHHAAMEGHQPIIDYLLEHGANVHYTDRKYRKTALHYLVTAEGNDICIQSLLNHNNNDGGDGGRISIINARDNRGCTPLHLAAAAASMPSTSDTLEDNHYGNYGDDENVDEGEKKKDSIKNNSVQVGLDTIQRLLTQGADPTLRNDYGESPLHCAAQGGDVSIVRLLLDHHHHHDDVVDESSSMMTQNEEEENEDEEEKRTKLQNNMINATDRQGETPLHCAIQLEHGMVAELLLDHGANINQTDGSDHRTALYMAVQMNSTSMVQLLVHRKADPTIPDQYGRTPGDLAAVYGLESIYPLLV